MTKLYWLLKQIAPPVGRVFFGEIKVDNFQNVPVGKPYILVANHPSSLLDPIVCGSYIDVPIQFLGRADFFKNKFVAKLLRSAQMWPIYRDRDGKDALAKNKQVFAECYESLREGNPILLYGEGVTDERFIRRIKTIKKGAARIAFGAEESYDFSLDLKIVPVAINYTNSEYFGCDLNIRFAEPIDIKQYEIEYKKNAVKCMLKVTREIETRMRSQAIHVEKISDAKGFEKVLMLFENSMHYRHLDGVAPISIRWEQSKKLANQINEWDEDDKANFFNRLSQFWNKLHPSNSDLYIIRALNGLSIKSTQEVLELIVGFPIAAVGGIINLPTFVLLKKLPPKLAKRITFHSGMKIAFGTFAIPLFLTIEYVISLFFIYIPFLYPAILIGGIITGAYALRYREVFKRLKRKNKAKKILGKFDLEELKAEYESLVNELKIK